MPLYVFLITLVFIYPFYSMTAATQQPDRLTLSFLLCSIFPYREEFLILNDSHNSLYLLIYSMACMHTQFLILHLAMFDLILYLN